MKTIKYVFGLLILLSSYTYSQEDLDPVKYSSFEGTHFYIGYMQNEISIDPVVGLLLQAYIVSTSKATVTVQLPWGNKKVYILEKDSVLKLDFDEVLEARESEVVSKELVEITSDVPINVYAFNSQVTTSDSYSAVPVSSWGKEYVVMSYCNDQYAINQEMPSIDSAWYNYPRQSEFMVLAAYDETEVIIKPSALTEEGKQVGKNYVVNLNKGQCYLVKSVLAPRGYADLSGTIVRANKPIGVISGHVRTAIPWYLKTPYDSKDHIAEMLTPTEAWGKNFITVPFGLNPKGDLVRVANIIENTTVRCETENGIKTLFLKQPGSIDSMMYLNLPAHWTSDKPVQLAQYMIHSGIEEQDSRFYDPSMVIISPIEQYVSKIVFQTPGNSPENWGQYIQHQVSFVVDKKAKDYLTLDGEPVKELIPISSNNVFNTDYYWGVIEITKSKHKLLTNNGFFSGIVYGNGAADSYAMTLGSSLISPNRKDSISPSIEYSSDCGVLEGIIYERKSDINASGLSYILVDEDNTYNYDYKISPMTDTSYYITFNAKPIDKLKKGQLMIDVRDKAGNGKRLNYIYEPISIKTPKEIMFWGIDIKDSSCVDFYIINNGDSAITLENIDIFEELRLTYYVSKNYVTKTLPFTIQGHDSVKIKICFKPGTSSKELKTYMTLGFNCDTNFKLDIKGTVFEPALYTSSYNFGNVKVGDTLCTDLFVTNNGTVPIKLYYMDFSKYSSEFIFDTTGLFPVILNPGDTLTFEVCFAPRSRGEFESNFSYINEFSVANSSSVTGKGISGLIDNIVINWGRRRIGSTNDTTEYIKNNGDAESSIKFKSFIEQSDGFLTQDIENIDRIIMPKGKIDFDVSYVPTDTIDYYSKIELLSDINKNPIYIELMGKGIMPYYETFDIEFDTTIVFKTRDTIAVIVKSKGNDDLIFTLDKITGDVSSFIINDSYLLNKNPIQLKQDSSYSLNVTFNPQKIGYNEIILELNHNSNSTETAKIKISGYAISDDTLTADLSIQSSATVLACQKSKIYVSLTNTGNVPLELQELDYEIIPPEISVEWNPENNLPISFLPDSTLHFGLEVLPTGNQIANLKVQAKLNDTIQKIGDVTFNVITQPLSVLEIDTMKAVPGDSVSLSINGVFPKSIDISTDFEIVIKVKKSTFWLKDDNPVLILNKKNGKEYIEMTALQTSSQIILKTKQPISLNEDNISFSLKLNFLTLLDSDRNPAIEVMLYSKNCFDSDSLLVNAEITEVCVFSHRGIQLIQDMFYTYLYPNPASDNLNLKIISKENEEVEIKIFDKVGKKLHICKNLYLKKGEQTVNFEISHFNSGIYVISIQTKSIIKNLIFIISK